VDYSNTQTSASIRNEATVRATADTALASVIQTLEAEVDIGLTNTNAAITNEATVRATADAAEATARQALATTFTNNLATTNAAITNEATARATADTAEATARQALATTFTNNLATTNAAITTEATTRATADTALSTSITNLTSTVTGNFNTLNSRIATEETTRANADTTNANAITSLTSTVNGQTANITTLTSTTASITGALSATWSVVGNINGSTGGLVLSGVKRADGTGATYDLEISANTKILGNLVVDGTINGTKIGTGANGITTPNIQNNSVSNSASSQGAGTASASITVRAGARVSVLATYAGNRSNGTGGGSNTLRVRANGADFPNNTTSIFSVALVTAPSSQAYISNTFVITGIVTNYASTPATLLTIYNAPSDGAITFTADSGGWNETVSLLVMELAR
jgi:hypothetical protein